MPKESSFIGIPDEIPVVGIPLWKLGLCIGTLIVGFIVVKFGTKTLKSYLMKAKMEEILAEFITKVVRLLLYVFVVGTAFGFLGLNIGPAMISLSVVLGFVLGFALGDTLSNIASGFMIAVTRPFKVGDFVTVNGETGVIKTVGISNMELDTPDNKHVVIPNKAAWGSNIINFTHNPTRRIDMEAGVSYETDLDLTIRTTFDVLKADPRILEDPAPNVAVKEMADSAVVFVVRPWVKTKDYWDVFFDTQKAIKEAYDAAGISIPFPQMDVHLDKSGAEKEP